MAAKIYLKSSGALRKVNNAECGGVSDEGDGRGDGGVKKCAWEERILPLFPKDSTSF